MWKDCETNLDLLDFDYLVDVVKKIILNDNLTPSTIGIYGDWGSGKSSLMDMVMCDLSKEKIFYVSNLMVGYSKVMKMQKLH
jgi:predicted ATPase